MRTEACHKATGARPACELADIVRAYGHEFRRTQVLPRSHLKVLRAIETCRTAALGGHRERCASCSLERYAYNSCRNRHCPKCQSLAKAQWLEARQAELLPVPYFHNVFTLPHELNPLILCQEENKRALLDLLFRATAETLLEFGRNNLGAVPGITMVLHTWDQQLRAHFHVHCVITGGGLSLDGQSWIKAHPRYLFPVRALGMVFRGKFLDGLRRLYDRGELVARQVQSLREGDFVDRKENLLGFGKPGSGKTHLLCALAQDLVHKGRRVRFFMCSLLVQGLLAAKRDLKLSRLLKRLANYEVLLIDDLGYVQQNREEMEVLFTLLADRYERGSVWLTSNLPFSKWEAIFKDPMTTAAAIDRLVHHSVIVELNLPSYRLEHATKAKEEAVPA